MPLRGNRRALWDALLCDHLLILQRNGNGFLGPSRTSISRWRQEKKSSGQQPQNRYALTGICERSLSRTRLNPSHHSPIVARVCSANAIQVGHSEESGFMTLDRQGRMASTLSAVAGFRRIISGCSPHDSMMRWWKKFALEGWRYNAARLVLGGWVSHGNPDSLSYSQCKRRRGLKLRLKLPPSAVL